MNFRILVRDIILLLGISTFLGFTYTLINGQGFFAPQKPLRGPVTQTSGATPVMINLAEAQRSFETGTALFIDTRDEFVYRRGHIRGAINIPLKDFETRPSFLNTMRKDSLIVTYCDGADCNSSIEFAARLFGMGFTNIKIFFGGWTEWKAENLPMEESSL